MMNGKSETLTSSKVGSPMTVYCSDGSFEFTPVNEVARIFAEMQNEAYRQGFTPHTEDEVLRAIELERAGYDGLGQLWGKEDMLIQA
jgi:hypothetical protein